MNSLKVVEHNGELVTDSRMVAEMVDKEHKNLVRDIRGYIKIMEEKGESNFGLSSGEAQNGAGLNFAPGDFFIKSSYLDANNQERPCFLCTKKGCEMIANKMTGEKGVLFTAAYVSRFEEMEKQIQIQESEHPRSDIGEIASLMKVWLSMMTKAKIPYQHGIAEMIKFMQAVGIPITDGVLHQEHSQFTQLSMDFTFDNERFRDMNG